MSTGKPLRDSDPRQLGRYRLTGRLGAGGMGIVYAGVAEEPDGRSRLVAVKVIHPHLADAREFRTRFRSEAALAARVARFSTAAVLDVDVEGEQPFLVTEFVDGPTLQAVVEEQGPLDGGALDAVAIGIATALVAIHDAGIVHRDLKPSNVILSRFGPRVIDFGIARAADVVSGLTSGPIGSPPYMAPEQFRGDPITPATDVYAWGAAVCFAGTGSPPFGVGPPEVMLYRTLEKTPTLTALDESLRDLAEAALRKDPSERPTARDLLTALTQRHPTTAPPAPPRATAATAVTPAADDAALGSAAASPARPAGEDGGASASAPWPPGTEADASAGSAAAPSARLSDHAAAAAGSGAARLDVGAGSGGVAVGAPPGRDGVPLPAERRGRRRGVVATAAVAVVLAVVAAAAVTWLRHSPDAPDQAGTPARQTTPDLTVRQFAADDTATGPAPIVDGAERGGTVDLYAAAQYWELDPVQNRFADGMMASSRLLARTLTAYREDSENTPTLVGDLATDTGRSTDGGRTWEFTIRAGVTFANGTPVTARDVAHGIARSFTRRATGASYLQRWLAGRTDFRAVYTGPTEAAPYPPGVTVPDDRTLRLRFPAPHPDLPTVAALPTTSAVPDGWRPTANDPVPVTGPYRVAKVVDKQLTLVRNTAWDPNTDPVRNDYPERYVVHFGVDRDDVTRLLMDDGATRGVQLNTVQASQASEIYRRGLANRLVDGPGAGHRDLCFNTRRVTDPARRRALSLAFNPESALQAVGGPYIGDLTSSLYSPRLPGYPAEGSRTRRSGNSDAARAALDGAQVTLVFAHRKGGEGDRLATAVTAAFARAGVKVQTRAIEDDKYLAEIGRRDNPYDLYICEWTPDYLDGNAMLPMLYSGGGVRESGNKNVTYFDDTSVNAELDRLQRMPDRAAAAKAYAALARRLATEFVPAIPFFDQRRLALFGSDVRGLFVSSLWAVPDLARVWVAIP